jgi:oligopeptide transport system permease protein
MSSDIVIPEKLSNVPFEATKGLSLSQDAWRRLKKNHVAMFSLGVLTTICVLAFLTPLLPLQAPDSAQTNLQYSEPLLSPLWLNTFKLDEKAIARTPELVAKLQAESQALEENFAAAKDKSDEEYHAAREALRRKQAEIQDTIQAPYRKLGFPQLGGLSRWMVRTRYALFGERSLNSICGRDVLGRDTLSRLFWGARISLLVGLVATIVSLVIGVTYGAVSGYCGGWIDDAMMRFVDVLYSVPFIFVVIFLLTILGEERIADELAYWGIDRITVFFLVVGAIYWLTMSRVVRGQVISLKHESFVEAARSLGASQKRIIFLHLMPNLLSVVLVYLTLTIPRVMLFEAFLSFLGLGVEPPDVSWGLLANEGIKVITPVKIYWWLILFPSIALGSTLMALNFLGDGVRDALDPRLRDA